MKIKIKGKSDKNVRDMSCILGVDKKQVITQIKVCLLMVLAESFTPRKSYHRVEIQGRMERRYKRIRKQLRGGALRRAERDLEIAQEWSSLYK